MSITKHGLKDVTMIRINKNLFIFATLLTLLASCATRAPGELKEKTPTEKKAELYYDYGTNALVEKNYTKALTNLKKAVATIDDDSRFHNNLAMAYYFRGDVKNAIEHLNRSISLDESNSDAKNNLASIYFEQNKDKKAEKLYREVLTDLEYPKQFRVYYNLGLLAQKHGRKDQAIKFYEKATKINKTYCPAQYQLGELSFKNNNYHQASIYFQNAYLGSCNDNPVPYYQEALSLINLGEDAKALLKFKELIDKFPTSKEAILSNRKVKSLSINSYRKNKQIISQSKMHKPLGASSNKSTAASRKENRRKIKAFQF